MGRETCPLFSLLTIYFINIYNLTCRGIINKRYMKGRKFKVYKSLLFNLSIAFAILILAISMIISTIGYYRFTNAITLQYEESAYNAGATVQALIENDLKNGGNIDKYIEDNKGIKQAKGQNPLECGFTPEYAKLLSNLEILCDTQNVSMIFVIKLTDEFSEKGKYTTYYSVFDVLTKEDILPSYFAPWEVGAVNLPTQQIKEEDRALYEQIWFGQLDKASIIQRQDKGSDMFDHITSIMPIHNAFGKVTAIVCIQQPMFVLKQTTSKYMMVIGIVTVALIAVFILVGWLYLNSQIAKPLRLVSTEAERFAKDTTAPDNPIRKTIKSRIGEISSLIASISDMEHDTLDYIKNIETITAEQQRIGAELDLASHIQENSIPRVFPAFPERKEFDLYANMVPAKEVGGDFYSYFLIDDDHLAFTIADVSGKGVPAALFMMVTMILINERSMLGGTPDEIIKFVNERICSHNEAEMFVTAWFGILEISTGKITATNAGHDDPAILRDGKVFDVEKAKHGLVLGAMAEAKYTSYEIQLKPGDKIFLYTDGIPEATNGDMKLFGIEQMVNSLNKHKDKNPQGIIEGVKEDVNTFVASAPQFDDMTMLCVEYKGGIKENSIELDATDENLEKINDFIRKAVNSKCSEKTLNQLLLVVEELYINVAHYAYKPEIGKVRIDAEVNDNLLRITLTDSGKPYNPLERQDPDITLDAKDRSIGGLGVFMSKKLVDKISYERVDEKNILILEKKF